MAQIFTAKTTSNGEVYNMYNMTAAHKTLPMNTILKVTNLRNQKSVIVRVNDRGPFVADRVLDLSKAAAMKLDVIGTGTAPVSMEVIGFNEDINAVTTASAQPTKPTSTGIKSAKSSLSNSSGWRYRDLIRATRCGWRFYGTNWLV